MSVDAATVRRIAHLARIAVAETEVPHLQGELNAMLAFVEQLSEVNVDGVEPMTSVMPMEMKKRPDVVNDGEIADDVVRNAPATEDPFLSGAESRRIGHSVFETGNPMCLLCDDEKAYQAYMNYLDAMERQGKAADPDKADGRRARCSSRRPTRQAQRICATTRPTTRRCLRSSAARLINDRFDIADARRGQKWPREQILHVA